VREVTASGQTVEEAIQSALEQLNITQEEANIEVIDEGKKGFLGLFGSSISVVKVKEKTNRIEETEQYLNNIMKHLELDISIEKEIEDQHVTFNLTGDKIAILIGKRGKTLNALQYLTHLVLNKKNEEYYKVTVDAEGYRERREEVLVELAHKMAEKALYLKRKVMLEPMPAYERKIIHSTLQERNDVTTYSDGIEPHRSIIIEP